jgi:hypothetical protein
MGHEAIRKLSFGESLSSNSLVALVASSPISSFADNFAKRLSTL